MQEREEGFYLDFDQSYWVQNGVLSLALAPVIPEYWAQVILCFGLFFLALLHLGYFGLRRYVKDAALNSDVAKLSFVVSGQTVLVLTFVLAWLGFAGLLWTFESFFVLFALIHSTTSSVNSVLNVADMRVLMKNKDSV